MKRIMIIGCGGSGKSTLARKLGEKLHLPVVHLDKLFWTPGWVHISREEFDKRLLAALEEDKWIIDGNFDRTIPVRLQYCDTVIYLDYSRMACIRGVLKRMLTTYGTVRTDIGEGCPERFDWEFLKRVWNFNKEKRDKNHRLLKEVKNVRVLIFKNRRQLRKFLRDLETTSGKNVDNIL